MRLPEISIFSVVFHFLPLGSLFAVGAPLIFSREIIQSFDRALVSDPPGDLPIVASASANPQVYRDRGKAWQAQADKMAPGKTKDGTLSLAEGYAKLAELIE
jgi:hypothetical protein